MADRPTHPPRFAAWLLRQGLPPGYEAVLGDLEEEYHDHTAAYGKGQAAWLYRVEVLRTLPAFFVTSLIWHTGMLKNYAVVALRMLRKHKGFAAINILGLAVSMSVCLLVIALIKEQHSSDRFHKHSERIYRITSEVESPYGTFRMATSPAPLAPTLLAAFPGVEAAVRFTKMGGNATFGEQTFQMGGLYAEPSFFDVFDFDLAQGDVQTALNTPYSLILTQETAEKFFGTTNAVGKVIHRDGVGDFTVTGVLAAVEQKTHLSFEALASFSTLEALEAGGTSYRLDEWQHASGFYNYLVLAKGTAPEEVAALSNSLVEQQRTGPDDRPLHLEMQALTRINLGEELSNQIGPIMPAGSLYFLVIFGLGLMLVAVFNYISLTVARSLKRAREIGIRKVMGAQRAQVVQQFLSEAVIVAMLSMLLAAALLFVLLPGFNSMQGFQEDLDLGSISVDVLGDGWLYLLFLTFAVGVGVVAGLYPAFRMSSYLPTRVLKGGSFVQGFSGLMVRRGLIVFQFCLAIFGVITTMVIYQQLSFLMQSDYGFGEEQMVIIDLQDTAYETIRNEWVRLPGVEEVVATSSAPVVGSKTWTDIQAQSMDEPTLIMFYAVDEPFLDAFNLTLQTGRSFSETLAEDTAAEEPIWVTKETINALGLETPEAAVGQVVSFDNYPEPHTAEIVGVVDDIYARGIEKGYVPLVLRRLPDHYNYAIVRVRPGTFQTTLASLASAWKAVAPTMAFTYQFYDEEMEKQYLFMQDLIKFFGLLASFVIFIACLGLLGMAAYSVETRTKEVGIRKVLGADVRGVVMLLSRDYLILLLIAVMIATPLAYLFNNFLLNDFAVRIPLNGWIFVAAIVPIITLALLTIGSQTVKAGFTNPVDTLRQE